MPAVAIVRASARRFAARRWLDNAVSLLALAITGTVGILRVKSHPLVADHPSRWAAITFASTTLIMLINLSYLTPRAFPRIFGATVRMANVDESAAEGWRSANDPGLITVKPDNPALDLIVRHGPPLALVVVLALVALLT